MTRLRPQDVPPGTVLAGKYRVLGRLGRGAMGVVYRAEDLVLGRMLALKLLVEPAPETGIDPLMVASRFLREARSAGALSNPHVVKIYEASEADGLCYIAMELVEGGSLDAYVEQHGGPVPVDLACAWGMQAASGLGEAHRAGIIHRDVKPGNLLMSRSGTLKISDFGIAKPLLAATELTQAGAILGTIRYMAPEALQGHDLDGRADQFSLGCVLYWLLSGKPAFDAADHVGLLYKILFDPLTPLRSVAPAVPEALVRIVERCLAKSPEDRFPGMADLEAALVGFAEGAPGDAASEPAASQRGQAPFASDPEASRANATTERLPAVSSLTDKLPARPDPSSPPAPQPSPLTGPTEPPADVLPPARPARRRWPAALAALLVLGICAAALWLSRGDPLAEADRLWAAQDREGALQAYQALFWSQRRLDPHVVERLRELAASGQKPAAPASRPVLRILNWPNYVSPLTLFLYAQAAGVDVEIVVYERVEDVLPMLEREPFDLLIVPEGIVLQLIRTGRLVHLDRGAVPNLSNLDPFFTGLRFDPGNEFSAPYLFNTLALLYNPQRFSEPPDSWDAVFEPEKLRDKRVGMPDHPRSVLGAALKYRGYAFDSTDPAHVRAANETVQRAAPSWVPLPKEEDLIADQLLGGQIDLTVLWSDTALRVAARLPSMRLAFPKEGSNLSVDSMVIPRGSRDVPGALRFIDHVLDERVGAELAGWVPSGTPNLAARRHVDLAQLRNEDLYPTLEILNRWDLDLHPVEVMEVLKQVQAEPGK